MSKKDYFSIAEVAKMLGISRTAVYKKVKKGQIQAVRIGRSFAINDKVVNKIINVRVGAINKKEKRDIDKVVARAIDEYGETLKKLGSE
ncbi:helix-turn-helix domain-containing protein [Candidatus Margulisiibacteriota bacterium]